MLKRHATAALVAVTTIPMVVAVARYAGRPATLAGDVALLWMRVGDVVDGHLPTTGFYSRYGWDHPGPAVTYLLAPVHFLTGGATWGSIVAVAAWTVGTSVLTAWLASRRGGSGLIAAALAAEVAVWVSVGGRFTIEAWPPYLAASLTVPFLLAAWGAADRDGMAAIAAVAAGSVLIQAHVGYTAVVVAALGAAAVFASLGGRGTFSRRHAAIAAGVLVVVWTPVLVDTIVNWPGNLSDIYDFFSGDERPAAGWETAGRLVAVEVKLLPPWLAGPEPTLLAGAAAGASVGWLAVLLVPVIAVAAGWTRLTRPARSFVVIVGAATAAGLVSLAQVRDLPYPYLSYWRAGLVTALVVAVGLALVGAARAAALTRAARAAAVVWLVAGVSLAAVAVATVDSPSEEEALAEVVDRAKAEEPADGFALLRFADPGFLGVLHTLMDQFERDGIDARVDRDLAFLFGEWRTAGPDDSVEIWYVSENAATVALLEAMPGARLIAGWSPLSAADQEQLDQEIRAAADALRTAGRADLVKLLDSPIANLLITGIPGLDRPVLTEIAEANGRRDGHPRLGVVAFEPNALPTIWWDAF